MLAPSPSAQLIEAFANTVNLEYGTDAIGTPEGLSAWLMQAGVADRDVRPNAVFHDKCLRLRAGIREALGVNVGVDPVPDALGTADEVLAALPVHVGIDGRPLTPAAALPPADAALAAIAVAWAELRITGDAARLKRCAEHTCELVFWDVSKNRSRRWCSMRACGNRAKTRRYAARNADRRHSA